MFSVALRKFPNYRVSLLVAVGLLSVFLFALHINDKQLIAKSMESTYRFVQQSYQNSFQPAITNNSDRILAQQLNLLDDDDPALFARPASECSLEFANSQRLQQNHPCVIQLIRRHFLHPPASRDVAYFLPNPKNVEPSGGQAALIREKLKNQTNGFFIECGALDGEWQSNTLFMERFLNWTGLLVEADQKAFGNLMSIRRKAYALPVCLSLDPYPTTVKFDVYFAQGTIHKLNETSKINEMGRKGKQITVQCFPLYSILLAIERTQIDFFSLDVEGHELSILKTIPWHKVDIKTMTIEWWFVGKKNLIDLLKPHGYDVFAENKLAHNNDLLFAKYEVDHV